MIDFESMLTDELTEIRSVEYSHRNFVVTDLIRNILDSRGSFCVDTANGQDVYHMGPSWAGRRLDFNKDFGAISRLFK